MSVSGLQKGEVATFLAVEDSDMGIFSSIKKFGKKILGGISKVFKKVGKFVSKITGSKWGKILLIAASAVTMGMALYAGVAGGMAHTGTLMSKFVVGAKDFMSAFLHPIQTGKAIASGQSAAASVRAAATAAEQMATVQGVTGVTQTPSTALEGVAEVGAEAGVEAGAGVMGPPAPAPSTMVTPESGLTAPAAPATAPPTVAPPVIPPPAEQAGLLSRAATGAKDFASSTGGGLLIGNVLSRYGQAAAMEEADKRITRAWRNPRQLAKLNEALGRGIRTPGNMGGRAVENVYQIRKGYGYPATVGPPAAKGG